MSILYHYIMVSIHAPTRGATPEAYLEYAYIRVSIHAPTRGATWDKTNRWFEWASFNPRSHEGSDYSSQYEASVQSVSIHAPTRGATQERLARWRFLPVSIHAPTRGATFSKNNVVPYPGSFNPRSHEGSDWYNNQRKGAMTCFNPRSHEGSDQSIMGLLLQMRSFNPRSHEGSDIRRPLRG